ncbi:MAG: agmatine deiminase family protein [Candidatus Eisenbacteria bacterium]
MRTRRSFPHSSARWHAARRSGAQLGLITLGLIPVALLASFLPSAVHAERDVDGIEELLPHQETQAEWDVWRGREAELDALHHMRVADPPPLGPVRNCAEWEPLTGVLIRYPLGLPYELLRDMDDELTLHVVVSSGNLTAATNNLTANGVDMAKVEFLVKPNDSIWTRDYGPWFVFDGNEQLTIIDHVYNRPARPNDDLIPIYFGEQQGIPVIHHDMWHTGGNYMTDGAHISGSTRLVYNEAASANGMTSAQVDQLMLDYYGVETYTVLDYIESGGIHHIDTWGKFLDEETVLIKDVWPTHGTYANLNQRAALLASLPSSTGRNYQVYRVYCYNIGSNQPASYTNSLLANDRVYVPLFGNATYDADALDVYRQAMPGYDVRGYVYGGWLTDDALHCRAKGVMDRGMLRVEHTPVRDPQEGSVVIQAKIVPHSGEALTVTDVHYRQDGGAWNVLAMAPAGGDVYEAVIPAPGSLGDTDYYVQAEDGSGRREGMPRVEPAAWYTFPQSPASAGVGELPNAIASIRPSRPNPFRDETIFSFTLAYPDQVELAVFDTQGRLVRSLLVGQVSAGPHEVHWDGRDDAGRTLPAGVYRYRLRAAGLQYSRPVQLLK